MLFNSNSSDGTTKLTTGDEKQTHENGPGQIGHLPTKLGYNQEDFDRLIAVAKQIFKEQPCTTDMVLAMAEYFDEHPELSSKDKVILARSMALIEHASRAAEVNKLIEFLKTFAPQKKS